ncbi:MAG: MFS transporter [Chloroflexota bacterium]
MGAVNVAQPVGTASEAALDYPRIGVISAGHLLNDLYSNLLIALMPYFVLQGKISATMAGLILLVYLLGSSILQPLFGLLADHSGLRLFAIIGPLWVGIGACLTGWAPDTRALFALAAFSSIGSAAFHPQAASMVNGMSPRQKGWTMSLFSMGGNIGFAFGPVLAAGVAVIGLRWSPLALLPGIVLTLLLARFAPRTSRRQSGSALEGVRGITRRVWGTLSLVIAVIATRSGTQYCLIIFLPLLYHARGSSAELGSIYAFVLSLSGALGGLLGGSLSDRYGQKLVVVSTLVAAVPLLALALTVHGPLVWPLLIWAGAALLASNSLTVVQGQQLLPGSMGVASGLTLGLAFGLSGVIASAFTALSDHVGIATAVHLLPALPLMAAILAVFVPAHDRLTVAGM